MTVINSLWHFTEEKFIFNRNHIYGSDKHELKPSGLWLSNENGKNPWSEFCFNNSEPELLNYMTEFKIKDDSNILIINSYDDAIKLNEEYAYTRKNDFFGEKMRWDKIKKKYHGILIPDYIKPEIPNPYSKRHAKKYVPWYDFLDCASGVFWDLSVLEIVS